METIDKETKYEFDKAVVKLAREQIEEDQKNSVKDAMDVIKKSMANLVKLNLFQSKSELHSIEFQKLPKAVRTIIIDKLEDGSLKSSIRDFDTSLPYKEPYCPSRNSSVLNKGLRDFIINAIEVEKHYDGQTY